MNEWWDGGGGDDDDTFSLALATVIIKLAVWMRVLIEKREKKELTENKMMKS